MCFIYMFFYEANTDYYYYSRVHQANNFFKQLVQVFVQSRGAKQGGGVGGSQLPDFWMGG